MGYEINIQKTFVEVAQPGSHCGVVLFKDNERKLYSWDSKDQVKKLIRENVFSFVSFEKYLLVQIENPGSVEVYDQNLVFIKVIQGDFVLWKNTIGNNTLICEGRYNGDQVRFLFDQKKLEFNLYPRVRGELLGATCGTILYSSSQSVFLTSKTTQKPHWELYYETIDMFGGVINGSSSITMKSFVQDQTIILYASEGSTIVALNLSTGKIKFVKNQCTLIGIKERELIYKDRKTNCCTWVSLLSGEKVKEFKYWDVSDYIVSGHIGTSIIFMKDIIIGYGNRNELYVLSKDSNKILHRFQFSGEEDCVTGRVKLQHLRDDQFLAWSSGTSTLKVLKLDS